MTCSQMVYLEVSVMMMFVFFCFYLLYYVL